MAKSEDNKYYVDGNKNVKLNKAMVTPVCRILYPTWGEATKFSGGQLKWEFTLVWDKTDEKTVSEWQAFLKPMEELIAQHPKCKAAALAPDSFIKDGDLRVKEDGSVRKEFAGKYYVSLSSNYPLECKDRSLKDVDVKTVEGGMHVRAEVRLTASTPSGTPRISLKPQSLQLVHDDGTRWGKKEVGSLFTEIDMMDGLAEIAVSDTAAPVKAKGKKNEQASLFDGVGE